MVINMRRERRLLIILISLILVFVILGGIFYLEWKSIRATEEVVKDFDIQRGYKTFQMSIENDGILTESFFITTKDDKVVDTRIIESGYSEEELEYRYIDVSGFVILYYNIEKGENFLKYNDNMYNGKYIDEIMTEKRKEFPNMIIREI